MHASIVHSRKLRLRVNCRCSKVLSCDELTQARGKRTVLPVQTSSYVGFAVFPAVYPTGGSVTATVGGARSGIHAILETLPIFTGHTGQEGIGRAAGQRRLALIQRME